MKTINLFMWSIIIIASLLFGCSGHAEAFSIIEVHNGQSIQIAINNAQSGDTVLVFNEASPYTGKLVLKDGVSLVAEATLGMPVIRGSVTMANNSTLTGFKVLSGAYTDTFHDNVGVYVIGKSNATIANNEISGPACDADAGVRVNRAGIKIDNSLNIGVYRNIIEMWAYNPTVVNTPYHYLVDHGGVIGISGTNLQNGQVDIVNNFVSVNAYYPSQMSNGDPVETNIVSGAQTVENNIFLKSTSHDYIPPIRHGCIISGYNFTNVNSSETDSLVRDQFVGPDPNSRPADMHLAPGSILINAGDPAILDADGSISDIGIYGGNIQGPVIVRTVVTVLKDGAGLSGVQVFPYHANGTAYAEIPYVITNQDGKANFYTNAGLQLKFRTAYGPSEVESAVITTPDNVSIEIPKSKLSGIITDAKTGAALANATVTIKPHAYGYGTHDYTVTTNSIGYYEITDVIRCTSSSGGTITWISYTPYVSKVGYQNYTGSAMSFSTSVFELAQNAALILMPSPPTTPVLADPGATNTTAKFLLDWSDSSSNIGIAGYEIQESVNPDFAPIPGASLYYKFDGNANDLSGNSYNGTVNGATLVTGKSGQAYGFDGVDDNIKVTGILPVDKATYSFWLNPSVQLCPPNNAGIIFHQSGTNGYVISRIDSNNTLRCYNAASGSLVAHALTPNEWVHVIYTFDNTVNNNQNCESKLYINGILVASALSAHANLVNHTGMYMGSYWNGAQPWWYKGRIDDFRVYNRVISDMEVMKLKYEMAIFCPAQSQYQFLLHDDGIFYYRVRAIDMDGVTSAWSNTVDIEIELDRQFTHVNFEAEDMDAASDNVIYDVSSDAWGGAYTSEHFIEVHSGQSVQTAVNKASSGASVYIYNDGPAYEENITLKEGVGLIGQGSGRPVINGTVAMKNNTSIIGLQLSGIRCEDASNITIKGNYITGFKPTPDNYQVCIYRMSSYGTSSNVTIEYNVMAAYCAGMPQDQYSIIKGAAYGIYTPIVTIPGVNRFENWIVKNNTFRLEAGQGWNPSYATPGIADPGFTPSQTNCNNVVLRLYTGATPQGFDKTLGCINSSYNFYNGTGSIRVNEQFMAIGASGSGYDLNLKPQSVLIDAGAPDALDPDGSRSNIGAYVGGIEAPPAALTRTFIVPKDNYYVVWLRMRDDNDSANAAAVSIDGDSYITVGNESGIGSQWRWVNFRDGDFSNRIIIYLTEGKHKLSLKNVESGTKIDSVIITDGLTYVPPDSPPDIEAADWNKIAGAGLDDPKNQESKLKSYKDSLYISTSNSANRAKMYKMDSLGNYYMAYDYKVLWKVTNWNTKPYTITGGQYGMRSTLDMECLDLPGNKSALYVLTGSSSASFVTKVVDDTDITSNPIGKFYGANVNWTSRGYTTSDVVNYKGYAYAGFYNDLELYFQMRRTQDPMNPVITWTNPDVEPGWSNVSEPAFGKDPATGTYYGNMSVASQAVFKDKLYVATSSGAYFGRTNQGAQIWRTDGTPNAWSYVMPNGFGKQYLYISKMCAFGGYLYVFGDASSVNYLYRTKDGITWEDVSISVVQGGKVSDIMPYMGKLYAITYNNPRVYSSADGVTWASISDLKFNDANNSAFCDLEIYRGDIYISTKSAGGTQIWKAKAE